MTKNDKIFRIISICWFLLHICVFLFVVVAGFLPFCETRNFYESFVGFFGKGLSQLQPYFLMTVLLSTCLTAFFAIKSPPFSLLVLILSLTFFVVAVLPYSIEAMIVGFASPWINASMSDYKIGFDLICGASYIVYFDAAFFVYSVVTLILRGKNAVE